MECITIICDDQKFKTRRRTIDGFFSLQPEQVDLKLDVDPEYFLPILEDLREKFETLVSDPEFRSQIGKINVADLELDVGGTTFWTSKETLSKSDYFKTTFNWGQSITFIDRNPKKFRQLLNYLRGIESDPGVYADFYLIERPLEIMEEEQNPEKLMEPYIRRDIPFVIENQIGLVPRGPKIKQSYVKNTGGSLIDFYLQLSQYGSLIDNIKLISDRGIKSYCIKYSSGCYHVQIIEDDHQNSYIFENLKLCPKIYLSKADPLHFNFELTGPGYLQLTFDLHFDSYNIKYAIPQTYNLIKYYGRSNRIDSIMNSSFNKNTIMFMFGRTNSNLTLKSNQRILYTSNQLSSIEYAIRNKLDPKFIYLPIDDYPLINQYMSIELNQMVDIWMINRYTLEYINTMPFIK